eukprot:scaffold213_cov245-Pinguiococcus_pyrenoidosus.AAC.30
MRLQILKAYVEEEKDRRRASSLDERPSLVRKVAEEPKELPHDVLFALNMLFRMFKIAKTNPLEPKQVSACPRLAAARAGTDDLPLPPVAAGAYLFRPGLAASRGTPASLPRRQRCGGDAAAGGLPEQDGASFGRSSGLHCAEL